MLESTPSLDRRTVGLLISRVQFSHRVEEVNDFWCHQDKVVGDPAGDCTRRNKVANTQLASANINVIPGRAKMSFRDPSMSTVAKVVGRLKDKTKVLCFLRVLSVYLCETDTTEATVTVVKVVKNKSYSARSSIHVAVQVLELVGVSFSSSKYSDEM